jgi:GlcNAc-P-P-Und epimerase
MHIHVIGGSGFIGTRLIKRLVATEHSFDILDKAPSATFPAVYQNCDVRSV